MANDVSSATDLRSILRLLSTRDARAFLGGLPGKRLVPMGVAIFSLFCTLGFVTDIVDGGRHPWPLLISNVLFGGTIGVIYGYTSLRSWWWRAGGFALHLLYVVVVNAVVEPVNRPSPDLARLRIDGFAIIVCITISYTFFLRFIGTAGVRYLSARAEIRLAAEIHAVLVPVVNEHIGEYQFFGVSRASGDVGGDLVDLVRTDHDEGWIGYIADVSGHGVSSGVLMGMTKSAARMRLRGRASLADLLTALNEVLYPLKRPSMYVTFAGVRLTPDADLEFTVAGHLPILRVTRAGDIHEATTPQIPIGIFENYTFTSGRLACEPGELLVLVTDGITDVFDRRDLEYGLDRVKGYLQAHAAEPLADIADGLLRDASSYGVQLDDQTLLLIRRQTPNSTLQTPHGLRLEFGVWTFGVVKQPPTS